MKKFKRSVEKVPSIDYNKRKRSAKRSVIFSANAKDKIKTYTGVFLAFIIVFTGAFNHLSGIFAMEEKAISKPTIIIDPGHGGLTNTID